MTNANYQESTVKRPWACFFSILLLVLASGAWAQKNLGNVTFVEGEAFMVKGAKQKNLQVNSRIGIGDQIRTGAESRLEITYVQGTILRIGEQSEITIKGTETNSNIQVSKGKVWANVEKFTKGDLRVTTPLATAAVRGTVFRVDTPNDSNSTVALYEGKVDVGPADTSKIKAPAAPAASGWGPPVEVPGPYEVSLETWIQLNPGKQVHVTWGGKYATQQIDADSDAANNWVKWNMSRDDQVPRTAPKAYDAP